MRVTLAALGPLRSLKGALRRTPLLLGWRWITSAVDALLHARRFAHVRTYCTFIGHGRSGHSIVGALLDAHPDVILSDELDALRYVAIGFSRNQIFSLSATLAADQARSKRRKSGKGGQIYSYFVPGQWQGRTREPRVVGDSRAAGAAKRLARDPALLSQLRSLMGAIDLRFIHVTRNPYDTIATMMLRTGRTFDDACEEYFRNWDAVSQLRGRLDAEELLVIGHETLIRDPRMELSRICSFLGVACENDYLDACAAILYTSPSRSRDSVGWLPAQRTMVEERMGAIDELRGYSFDD